AVASASPQDLSIGVGIEAIKDLTPAISATVFRNLTDGSRPTLFGIRYRLNENFVTRLSTTEGSENQSFSIEYESRF
ncbi:MAG: translocation/assembly module TamB domain-containing protein, partial [Gemmatimonadaceae bacterium]|nr:translocation/assembly module TamB domain-containing protein [Gloeobacterales cyanobacterium ES-bin-141]